MIAEVIINSNVKALNRIFDYNIPIEMNDKVKIGSRVLVKFANLKKLEEGFVVNLKEKSEYQLKDIQGVEEEYLNEERIELAKWMSKKYFCNVSECVKLMLPPGTKTKDVSNRMKAKKINFVTLKKEINQIRDDIENKKIKSDKQVRILKFLFDNDEISISDLELLTETSRAIIKTLEKNGYLNVEEKQVNRDPFLNKKELLLTNKLNLTDEQKRAFNSIKESIEDMMFNEFLLFGVTGSGKTEIYLQLIDYILKQDKTSIMLVPEISLTPQIVNRFIERFGKEKIAVLHSKLSTGERFDEWNRIKKGEAKIIIGARSAIFAPIENLGIVIVDEEHDESYKSEMSPRYDTKEIARKIARNNNIPLILGSATPCMQTYYNALNDKITLLELTKRANNSSLPQVEIVDLKEELVNGNQSMISLRLREEIEKNLKDKKQTILFLNKRGYSNFVMCKDCGNTIKCKNCNISLKYHSKEDKLKCHYCGYETKKITNCPECNSQNIQYFGMGTQKLELEIQKLFPNALTIRMDADAVNKKNSCEEILDEFKNKNIDILIGTQMVVKGHHFPNVTLVGVIAADNSLNMDDYRASEKTFQILTQVAGRAGREKMPGRVIIQTYNPESFSIEYSKEQNYKKFYETEIMLRKQLKYPPFCDIMLIGISSERENKVIEVSKNAYYFLKEKIKSENLPIILYPPLPAPIDKIKNKYRWRIIVKCKLNERIIEDVNEMLNSIYNGKNSDVMVAININPNNMI